MSKTENNGSDINLQEAPKCSLLWCMFAFSGLEVSQVYLPDS